VCVCVCVFARVCACAYVCVCTRAYMCERDMTDMRAGEGGVFPGSVGGKVQVAG